MGVNAREIHAYPYAKLSQCGCPNPVCQKYWAEDKMPIPLEALYQDPKQNSVLLFCPRCRAKVIGVRNGSRSDFDVCSLDGKYIYPEVEEYPELIDSIAKA